jgi:predicted TIM-barrel fold metal-dependent hydrolase
MKDKDEIIISADSHVMEPSELWACLRDSYGDRAPRFPERRSGEGFERRPGGTDPHERLKEMLVDGVSSEILYPTRALWLFGLEDADVQEACFKVYNDWLIDYCKVAPRNLVGVPAISVYDINHAVRELERCTKAGLRGALVWQIPHVDLPLSSSHYDRLWAAAQDLGAPVSLHTLTGRKLGDSKHTTKGVENYRRSIKTKLNDALDALFNLIFFGALVRYPKLKIVFVENEIGWIPFLLQQWDEYYRRFHQDEPLPIDMPPSHYFNRQVYATFIKDTVGGHNLERWGMDNCMWSSDYPHSNSTWPESRKIIERDLGHLSAETRTKILCGNVSKLYDLDPAALTQN